MYAIAPFPELLGCSRPMQELRAELLRIAPTELSLLIEGETGTGKQLVAEAVHRASARAAGPFVTFDCASVAFALAESELFGHERGAFTGADSGRPGVFEQADGGTIFLDELGELPLALQCKLLRVLEKRELRRLGGTQTIAIDVRFISATNRNLRAEVQARRFREDLYFRIAGARVHVPPLRERLADLPLLIEGFLAGAEPRRTLAAVPEALWDAFRNQPWPGNVRELRNAVQRMLVTPERVFDTELELDVEPSGRLPPLRVARRAATDSFEQAYLRALLAQAEGNVKRAAALAEVTRQQIHSLIAKHGL